jgi:nucleotide-binding universal stress UspA family protein
MVSKPHISKTIAMKTILVPTDFSDVATNAIEYAAEFSKTSKAKLLLFHACHFPIQVSQAPFLSTAEDFQLEEDSDEQMKLMVQNLRNKYGENFNVDYLSSVGFASDEITLIAEEQNIDLIIMGTHGIEGNNKFFGSNTIQVIKHTHCPILIIPTDVKFQRPEKIIFASDYKKIKDEFILNPLVQIAALYDSEIMIFNVEQNGVLSTIDEALEGIKLDRVFENIKHSYWFSEKKNIVDAINELSYKNHAAMITMIKRQHSFFERIFSSSTTELMTSYSHLPLLMLHE